TGPPNLDLLTPLLAGRARAQHAEAVWKLLHPPGPGVPYGGALVNDAGANADATTAIRLQGTDWRWRFYYSTTTVDNYIGAWVNGRQEMRIGDRYIKTSPADTLHDLINPFPVDPEMRRAAVEFKGNSATQSYGPLTALSTRELHLILAEAASLRPTPRASPAALPRTSTFDACAMGCPHMTRPPPHTPGRLRCSSTSGRSTSSSRTAGCRTCTGSGSEPTSGRQARRHKRGAPLGPPSRSPRSSCS